MAARTKIDEKEAQKIVAYYSKGFTLTETAQKFGRSYTAVQPLVKLAGVSRPRGRQKA